MTIEEFNILNQFILGKLKEENPFIITTTSLFNVINYDIRLKSGHNELYKDFRKYCNEFNPPYKVKSHYKSEESDKQFDIEFYQ
ncbi:MAG: hypothetical protein ACYDA4_15205 [Ignavibacteriaceae bacterium]